MSDTAWYNDVAVLSRRPDEFWPAPSQTDDERLNALVRLVAYVTLAVLLFRYDLKFLSFGVAAVVALSLVHHWGAGASCTMRRLQRCPRPAIGSAASSGDEAKPRAPAQACTLSTPTNPFANRLVGDVATRPPACKYDAQKNLIETNFNRGLVRNMYDIYDKENSQRQFITMPVTTSAPDTIAFAQFAYGTAGRATCKENPVKCTGAFP